MKPPLLDIKNLSIDFLSDNSVVHAVKNISLQVSRGEIVALVGESGSGKSVTSLSILQLLPKPPAVYAGGEILFYQDEKTTDLLKLSATELQAVRGNHISMIFQEPMTSLNPVMTCGRQVMEALLVHKPLSKETAKKQTVEWFEKVKLPQPEKIFDRYPHQLSGGQKQRVMIAMAMCCHPSLLICDEPTTALDVTVQKTILELIRDLQQQENMGVIFITHDLGVVAGIANRVAIMYKGEIVETGETKEIFRSPKHPYTKALIACKPSVHSKSERLPTVSDFLQPEEKSEVRSTKLEVQETKSEIRNTKYEVRNEKEVDQKSEIRNTKYEVRNEKEVDSKSEIRNTESDSALLKVENLVVKFPAKTNLFGKALSYVHAVGDVSFEIFKNETLGLVGESGCGKTTLGRTLLRLIEPSSGKIFFNGKDITAIPPNDVKHLRKNVQLVFQDPYSSLNPRLTIEAAIAEPMAVAGVKTTRRERKKKVAELLDQVNLSPVMMNRYPHEFSGGQRQRIVIARALSLNPDFLVCDESVSALDVSVQAQVLNLLNDLKKELGLTMLFISHDLSVVRYMCERILVMKEGKIIESGPAEEVYNHPKNAYTRQLIEAIPAL